MTLLNKRQKYAFIIAAALVAAAFVVSICVGRYPLTLSQIWAILTGGEVSDMQRNVFFTLRLPRTILAVMAGIALGMSGSVFQTIFKNPLASPNIIGLSNGANLGAAVAIVLLGHKIFYVSGFAFLGGMLVMGLVILLVRSTGHASTTIYILAGIILRAVSESLIMILKFFADPEKELAAIEFWAMGSFGAITSTKLLMVLPGFLIGLIGLICMRRQVSLLGLEEEESRALGVRVVMIRIVVLTFSTLMVTSVICLTGLINFVDLIAPHIARLVMKRTSFASCVFASLAGAFILLVSDCMARSLYSAELPISILTTLIGVPVLIFFMRRRKAGRL